MTYAELSMASAGWGFTLGSIAGDIVNNAKWCYTKKAYKTAKVTDYEIEQIMFWANKEGIGSKVSLAISGTSEVAA